MNVECAFELRMSISYTPVIRDDLHSTAFIHLAVSVLQFFSRYQTG